MRPPDRVHELTVASCRRPWTTVLALVAWAGAMVAVRWWGLWLVEHRDGDLKLGAIPLYGRFEWELSWRVLVPVAVGGALVVLVPLAARRLRWAAVALAAAGAAVAWSLALAVADSGPDVFGDIEQAYGRHTGLVDSVGAGAFVRDYVDRQPGYPVHLQAHPPGLVLGLWAAGRIGLSGAAFSTGLALFGVAVAVVAVLAMVRDVAGPWWSRVAAPFVVALPAAVWHTNADVIFAGVGVSGVALAVLATGRSGGGGLGLATAGGVVLGAAGLLSYGAALLAIPVLAIGAWRRRWVALAVTASAAVAVLFAPLAWGFWWLDGLRTASDQYAAGVAAQRGYGYFVVANLAVFALALGPATAVALVRLRERRLWIVVGSGLAMVLVADLSGLSSGETERIWQPFVPFVAVAGAVLGTGPDAVTRRWLGAQVATGVVLQAALRSPW